MFENWDTLFCMIFNGKHDRWHWVPLFGLFGLTFFRQAQISMSSACVPGTLDQESILDPWQPTARCAHSATYIPSRLPLNVSNSWGGTKTWNTFHCLPSIFLTGFDSCFAVGSIFQGKFCGGLLIVLQKNAYGFLQKVARLGVGARFGLGLMWRFVPHTSTWGSHKGVVQACQLAVWWSHHHCRMSILFPSIICIDGNCTHSGIWISQSTTTCPNVYHVLPKPSNTLPKRVKTRDPILQHHILWHLVKLMQFHAVSKILGSCHWQNADEGRVILSIRGVPGKIWQVSIFFLEDFLWGIICCIYLYMVFLRFGHVFDFFFPASLLF